MRTKNKIQIIGIMIIFNLKIKTFSVFSIIKLSEIAPIINSKINNMIETNHIILNMI